MLKTPLCDIFGIEVPIILAPMGTCTSAELAAAVSNEGGLGGIGTLFRCVSAVRRDIDVVRTLTSRPFAVNHIPQNLDAEAFAYTLQARPPVISFTLADPGDLVKKAHEVGAVVMVQVTTVAQAVQAAEQGVDVISAQGGESGGYCGEVSTMGWCRKWWTRCRGYTRSSSGTGVCCHAAVAIVIDSASQPDRTAR